MLFYLVGKISGVSTPTLTLKRQFPALDKNSSLFVLCGFRPSYNSFIKDIAKVALLQTLLNTN